MSVLDFHVYEMDMRAVGKIALHNVLSHKALARSHPDTPSIPIILSVVKKSYKVTQNKELYDAIDAVMFQVFKRDRCEIIDKVADMGAWGCRQYLFHDISETVLNTRSIFRVIVINSFNYLSAVKVLSGAIDMFCTNGMIVGEFDQFTMKHNTKLDMPEFKENLEGSLRHYYSGVKQWRAWGALSVTTTVAHDLLEQLSMSKRLRQLIYYRYLDHEYRQRGNNLFAVYSAMTWWATHYEMKSTTGLGEARLRMAREQQVRKWVASPKWTTFVDGTSPLSVKQ